MEHPTIVNYKLFRRDTLSLFLTPVQRNFATQHYFFSPCVVSCRQPLFQLDQTVWGKLKYFSFGFWNVGQSIYVHAVRSSGPKLPLNCNRETVVIFDPPWYARFSSHPGYSKRSCKHDAVWKLRKQWRQRSEAQDPICWTNPTGPVGWISRSKLLPEWLSDRWTKKGVSGDHIFSIESDITRFVMWQFCFFMSVISMSKFAAFYLLAFRRIACARSHVWPLFLAYCVHSVPPVPSWYFTSVQFHVQCHKE